MFSIIVAVDKNFCFGKNRQIPWKIKGEQQRFKNLTQNKTIVMGRTSFEEIGHPLKNRFNIIVSNTLKFNEDNCKVISNFKEFLQKNYKTNEEIFICGGEKIFYEALPYVNKIYLTIVDTIVENGDRYFPKNELIKFKQTYCESFKSNMSYTYFTFEREL